jgi:hypothetical protein
MLAIEKKTKKSDFISQRKAFEEFVKAQESEKTEKYIENAKNKFKIEFDEMDGKRKFNRKLMDEKPMTTTEAQNRMKDIELERDQQELELAPTRLFDGPRFDRDKFNAFFEKNYKNDDSNELVKRAGMPSPFNDLPGGSFIACEDEKYGDIYDEDENVQGTDVYSAVSGIGRKVKLTKDDFDKFRDYNTEYSSHNVVTKDSKADMERRMKERENDDKFYEARKYNDYDTDKNLGGYGILNNVGLTGNELEWDKEEIDEKVVRKLLSHLQSEEKRKGRSK